MSVDLKKGYTCAWFVLVCFEREPNDLAKVSWSIIIAHHHQKHTRPTTCGITVTSSLELTKLEFGRLIIYETRPD